METVVALAISVLAVVFVGSLIALITLCYHRYYKHRASLFKQLNDSHPDLNLIKDNFNNMELDDVQIHPEIDKILANAQWVDDATGLIPHCLSILKSCHHLTERLVGATMSLLPRYEEEDQQKKLWEIIRAAQKISPRVDDVVQSMYPPLDPRLLEARCSSLVLSVTQLALTIRFMCHIKSPWIEESTDELENRIRILREAGQAVLESCPFLNGPTANVSVSSTNSSNTSDSGSGQGQSNESGGIVNMACNASDSDHSNHSSLTVVALTTSTTQSTSTMAASTSHSSHVTASNANCGSNSLRQ